MKLIKPLLLTLFQIIIFLLLYNTGILVFQKIGYQNRWNIGWGLSLRFGLYLVLSVFLILNCLTIIKIPQIYKSGLIVIILLLFLLFWVNDIIHTPYKTIFFLLCTTIAFISKFLLQKFADKISKRDVESGNM
jgi:uncharacterized membrane protein YhaH (DUF805 family)